MGYEEQMEIRKKSEFFHSKEKGCNLRPFEIMTKENRPRPVKCKYCDTHKTHCCNCGWEFGYHYETASI